MRGSDSGGESFALPWSDLSALATKGSWDELSIELEKRLDEEELKLQRNGIKPNFRWLGWRVLIFAAYVVPEVPLKERLQILAQESRSLLSKRQKLLGAVEQNLEQLQALLAINTSAAWTELAGIMRRDMQRPDWALEAVRIALEKDKENTAAPVVRIAALGDLGRFDEAHRVFDQLEQSRQPSEYALSAISKVELNEGLLRDALLAGLESFKRSQDAPGAFLVAKIYVELGNPSAAKTWIEKGAFLEGPVDEKLTKAHADGLIKLANQALAEVRKIPSAKGRQ